MAVQFHELPISVFPKEARPYIARLNRELRDLFGLEGSLTNPRETTRSDSTIARRSLPTVDVSRITPSITTVVAGSSTVVGTPALTLGTANTVGTTTTALSVDSAIALFGTALPIGSSTTAVTGTSAFAERAGHQHPHSESLMVVGTTKTLTLTDSAAGPALTPSDTWTGSGLNLWAVGASNSLNVGKYGNLNIAGTAPNDQYLMNFSKTDFNEPTVGPLGINFTVTNSGIGDSTRIVQGINAVVTGSCANAGVATTRNVIGGNITITGGATGNTYFNGSVIGFKIGTMAVNSSVAGTSVVSVIGFQSFANSVWLRSATSNLYRFHSTGNPTLSLSATLANSVGYRCDAITTGTNRYGMDIAAFTTGTPTISTGVNIEAHSVGATKRSIRAGDSVESSKHLISGVSGFGCIVADTADGNYYVITTSSGVIGSSSIGTSLPAA